MQKVKPGMPPTAHIGYLLRASPDEAYLSWLRENWQGSLIVKGILNPEDTKRLERIGVDALWVSNHAGRQFDGAPESISMLPSIRRATTLPLVFDSGIESGLDILRALALGGRFCDAWQSMALRFGGIRAAGSSTFNRYFTQGSNRQYGPIGARKSQRLHRQNNRITAGLSFRAARALNGGETPIYTHALHKF